MGSRVPWRTAPRWPSLIAVTLVLTACGRADTVDETTPTSPTTLAAAAVTQPPSTASQGVPAPELAGTKWNVTSYSQGAGIITNVWKTELTIAFAADGTVSGSTGCNDYQGTWEVEGAYDEFVEGVYDANDGQAIRLSGLIWTEIACEDEAIVEQEEEHIDLLRRAGRWVIRYENFNLRSSDGEFLFEAEPLP